MTLSTASARNLSSFKKMTTTETRSGSLLDVLSSSPRDIAVTGLGSIDIRDSAEYVEGFFEVSGLSRAFAAEYPRQIDTAAAADSAAVFSAVPARSRGYRCRV